MTNKQTEKNQVDSGVSCFHKCLGFLPRQLDIVPLMEQQHCHTFVLPIRFGVGNKWRARTPDLLTAPSLCEREQPQGLRVTQTAAATQSISISTAPRDRVRWMDNHAVHVSSLSATPRKITPACFPPPLRFVFYLQFLKIPSYSSDSLFRICFCRGRRGRKKKCLWIWMKCH